MKSKNWAVRLEIMEALGWPATEDEWPLMLEALYRHCTAQQIADLTGISKTTILSDLPDGERRPCIGRPALAHSGERVREIAQRTGLAISTVYWRLQRGISVEAPDGRGKSTAVQVEGKTVKEWADEWGITVSGAHGRLVRLGMHKPDKRRGYEREAARFFGR